MVLAEATPKWLQNQQLRHPSLTPVRRRQKEFMFIIPHIVVVRINLVASHQFPCESRVK